MTCSPWGKLPHALALGSVLLLVGCDPEGDISTPDGGKRTGGGGGSSGRTGGGNGNGSTGGSNGNGSTGGSNGNSSTGGSNGNGSTGGGNGNGSTGGGNGNGSTGGGNGNGSTGGSNGSTGGGSGTSNGNVFRVNSEGRITRNGTVFPVRCGSWFGLQGRYEPENGAAPMELYVGNTSWANNSQGTGRTIDQTLKEISEQGINVVRMPVVHQTLDANDPMGRAPYLKNHQSVRVENSRKALEEWVKAAAKYDIQVMFDIHSCSNYVDWRKGRLDARPPYSDATRKNYTYTREKHSCSAADQGKAGWTVQPYNESIWIQDLKTLAGLGDKLGVKNIIGIDIFNEPWDYTWDEWKTLAEHAYEAVNSVNPNILVFVQGVSASHGHQDGTPNTTEKTPHGDEATNPNWGENLFEARTKPLNIPKERLVYSPHTYGPSVAVQPMFVDPNDPKAACKGFLEGDAVGENKCNLVINETLLRKGWEEHFGYLKDLKFGMVVGEFGGNMEWPLGQASTRDRELYAYLTDKTVDEKWQNAFVDYLVSKGIEGCFWSINPESGDTGGWYGHLYDPVGDTGAWGQWGDGTTKNKAGYAPPMFLPKRTTLLKKLWGMQ